MRPVKVWWQEEGGPEECWIKSTREKQGSGVSRNTTNDTLLDCLEPWNWKKKGKKIRMSQKKKHEERPMCVVKMCEYLCNAC